MKSNQSIVGTLKFESEYDGVRSELNLTWDHMIALTCALEAYEKTQVKEAEDTHRRVMALSRGATPEHEYEMTDMAGAAVFEFEALGFLREMLSFAWLMRTNQAMKEACSTEFAGLHSMILEDRRKAEGEAA